MPEVVEVQSVIDVLSLHYLNETIQDIMLYPQNHRKGLPLGVKIDESIKGQKITNFDRIGKYIIIELANDFKIATHLMMSGVFIMSNVDKAKKHLYVEFVFDNKPSLFFLDQRRFGKMFITKDYGGIKKPMIDALTGDFNSNDLKKMLGNCAKDIKFMLLMQQDKIAGIGNIYASEVLWDGKINPQRKCNTLSDNEFLFLESSIKNVLTRALKNKGSTLGDGGYFLPDGTFGKAQEYHSVYNKAGLLCKRCTDSPIVRIVQNSRSTFYCLSCQK